jgi:cytochrome oxidase Cu insertion factor (SCO1/SenC/PrrC family)
MGKWLLILVAFFSLNTAFSQEVVAPFKKNPHIPSFRLETVSHGEFKTEKLKKNVPTIIIFFSPSCEHCIHQMDAMMKRPTDLKKFQIVMATYQPIEELVEFDKKYNLAKHPNFITGRDVDYFLPPFYQVANFPHFVYYDKSEKLIGSSEGNISVDDILKKFK